MTTGRTAWEEQDRLESVIGSPLTSQGEDDVRAAGKRLASEVLIDAIYCGDAQAEQQSGQELAEALGLRAKVHQDLHELDYGLWQGLRVEDIRHRQPRLLKQWMDDPGSIVPPGGESMYQALERLVAAIESIRRRHKHGKVLLVLRPVMLAMARCWLEGQDLGRVWELARQRTTWHVYDFNGQTIRGE